MAFAHPLLMQHVSIMVERSMQQHMSETHEHLQALSDEITQLKVTLYSLADDMAEASSADAMEMELHVNEQMRQESTRLTRQDGQLASRIHALERWCDSLMRVLNQPTVTEPDAPTFIDDGPELNESELDGSADQPVISTHSHNTRLAARRRAQQ